jgi:S1-C subfamily serine protease
MATLVEELQETVQKVAAAVGPSVVRIGRGGGRGSGVVLAAGVVLTNAHNLRGDETTVTFADGRSATGTIRGTDPNGDLVVLEVDTGDAPAISWDATSVDPAVGSAVFALANPAGRGLRVTFGLVSAVGQAFSGPSGRRIGGSIEHTAPLNRGSSGGPIVNASGALVGLNTNRVGDGFYLAIPADSELKTRVDALVRGESFGTPRLGVALTPSKAAKRLRAAVGLPEREGLLVRGVQSESPAGRAGVREGDLLIEAGGQPLSSHEDLFAALDALTPGGVLAIKVVRGVDEVELSVSFAADSAAS